LTRQYGAELHAVYVIETRTGYDNAIVDPDTVRQNLREDGEEALTAVETEGEPDVSIVTSVREGVPHEELLSYIADQGIDLVVMGAKGRSAFETILLGSTTERFYEQIKFLFWWSTVPAGESLEVASL
jgi:nucleotide-binding universal stress UspA family protein